MQNPFIMADSSRLLKIRPVDGAANLPIGGDPVNKTKAERLFVNKEAGFAKIEDRDVIGKRKNGGSAGGGPGSAEPESKGPESKGPRRSTSRQPAGRRLYRRRRRRSCACPLVTLTAITASPYIQKKGADAPRPTKPGSRPRAAASQFPKRLHYSPPTRRAPHRSDRRPD